MKTVVLVAVWLGIIGAGWYLAQSATAPPAVVDGCGEGASGRELRIPVARDGHFYLEGAVNGTPVRFLVDTGASYVTIDTGLARRARLAGSAPAMFNTAAGPVQGSIARSETVRAACLEVAGLSVAVNPGLGDVGLLGQNFLRQFETVQTRTELILRRR
jgi:aspartyl protease family protein